MENENVNAYSGHNEVMPLYSTVMVDFYNDNPYEIKESETGLKLTTGLHESPDSGELERKDVVYRVGNVLESGPECKYVKPGDDVYVDIRGCRPFPFRGGIYWQVDERNIIAVMANDLHERFQK